MKMSLGIQHHDILKRGTMSHSAKNLPSHLSLAVAGIASRIIRGHHIIQGPDQKVYLNLRLYFLWEIYRTSIGFQQDWLQQFN
jgi:hypothetical protein